MRLTSSFFVLAIVMSACSPSSSAPASPAAPHAGQLSWVAHLDPMKGQLPEGLTLDASGEHAFLGLAPTGQILRVSLADGAVTTFGNVPPPPSGKGFLLGILQRPGGELFAGVTSSSADYQAGVYKLSSSGGVGVLYGKHPDLVFPNGLAFGSDGVLFVTDSLTGAIFRIAPDGTTTKWASEPLFVGDMHAPCANGAAFPIGVNGIVVTKDAIYTVHTDKGELLQTPINADGSAGPSTIVSGPDCTTLGGADGLTMDDDGSFYVAANAINSITRVTRDGKATVLASKDKFDFPASVSVGRASGGKALYVTNAALKSAQAPGGAPAPGLLVLPLVQ